MGDQGCEHCGRPVADTGYVCHTCAAGLRAELLVTTDLAEEVETVIARLNRHRPGDGRPQPPDVDRDPPPTVLPPQLRGEPRTALMPRPLPYSDHAQQLAWAAGNTLVTWARHVAESRGVPLPVPRGPGHGPVCRACHHDDCTTIRERRRETGAAAAARWLAGHVGWLRMQPEAGAAFDELHHAAHVVTVLVDSPPPRWYAGPCWADLPAGRCGTELYPPQGVSTVQCPDCGTRHDADQRRVWLLGEARDVLAHAGLIASAMAALGHQVTAAQIRGYAHRGRLLDRGVDDQGRPLYRVGDVADLLDAQVARRTHDVA